jgi:PAS domain S-box-containing protein
MKILLADDDAVSRLRLSGFLSAWHYEPTAADNGSEACRILKDEHDAPKLATLDWMMPGMDGVAVVHEVRKTAQAVPPYLILLTSLDSTTDTVRGLEAGAGEFIKKPFKPQELRARLQVGARIVQLQATLVQPVSEAVAALSAQKLAEEALQKSEERPRLLFATIPHPIWVYDRETLVFLDVNEAAIQHYGYGRREFLSMKVADIRPPKTRRGCPRTLLLRIRKRYGRDSGGIARRRARSSMSGSALTRWSLSAGTPSWWSRRASRSGSAWRLSYGTPRNWKLWVVWPPGSRTS